MQNEKLWSWLTVVILTLATTFSIYLTSHHYSLLYGMQSSKSICNINAKFDCDAVNVSQFSEVAGIPVALIAVFAFLVELFFVVGVLILDNEEKDKAARVFYYLAWCNIAVCLALAGVSTFILKTFCFYCITVYVLCSILFLLAWKLKQTQIINLSLIVKDLKSWVTIVLFAVIPIGSAFANSVIMDSVSKDIEEMVNRSVENWKTGKKFEFFTTGEPSFGPDSAPLKLIVFSDFQCPHCKRAAPSLHAFASAHKEQVQIVYQNYPLDSECNPKMQSHMHPESCFFAKVAICANKQGKYVEAHDWVFDHQDDLTHNLLDNMTKNVGLNSDELKSCMENSETNEILQKQIERANMAGLEGTPSIFANGKYLPNGFLIPVLERVLKNSLP